NCSYSILNDVDEAKDTLTINGIGDTVHGAPQPEPPAPPTPNGDVKSGNFFGSAKLDNCEEATGECKPSKAKCEGPTLTGKGTREDPWQNAEKCTLPFGKEHESRINVESFSHYTVKVADFEELKEHILKDDAELNWKDLCDGTPTTNCNPNPPPNTGANSQTVIEPIKSETKTTIHDAAHNPVTAVPVGSTVHDLVTVTGEERPGVPMQPAPTGNVNVDWFTNGGCSAPVAASSGSIGPLVPKGMSL